MKFTEIRIIPTQFMKPHREAAEGWGRASGLPGKRRLRTRASRNAIRSFLGLRKKTSRSSRPARGRKFAESGRPALCLRDSPRLLPDVVTNGRCFRIGTRTVTDRQLHLHPYYWRRLLFSSDKKLLRNCRLPFSELPQQEISL